MLVVFLGNPGTEYKLTRHNFGFIAAEKMKILDSAKWSDKFHGKFATVEIHGQKHMFLKPQTFMNLSGKSVQAAKSFFKLADTDIIVVHDDIETEFGTVISRKAAVLQGTTALNR